MEKRIKIYSNLFKLDFDWRFVFFKWLPALRSGDYNQGRRYLCNLIDGVKRYCCLGVGSDLYGFGWKAHMRICTIHSSALLVIETKSAYP